MSPGDRFGRLVLIEYLSGTRAVWPRTQARWRCRCDCGRETVVACGALKRGTTRSCGCIRAEKSAARARKLRAR